MDNIKKYYYKLRGVWIRFYNIVDWTYVTMIGLVLIGYLLIHDLVGETLLEHNFWDSYTLQAQRWLQGKVDLGKNYSHLEIAEYKGKFFVSFPPFPSVLLLPWVMIFGEKTPNNLIMIIYILIAITLVYMISKKFKIKKAYGAFWSIVVILGSNIMWMSTMGGVWFQAQLVNVTLLLGAILAMLYNKRTLSYIFVAFAVGCRPFSILYFCVLVVYYFSIDYINENKKLSKSTKLNIKLNTNIRLLSKQIIGILSAAIIGIIYMTYNMIRFNNPFEFGHNYLPEFVKSSDGQFSIAYLSRNLYRMFIRGIELKSNMGIDFTIFDGFLMYIANPIFILLFVSIVRSMFNSKKYDVVKAVIIACLLINIICIGLHKTLGGWQFGNRYLVDLVPFVYLYILMTKKQVESINKLSRFEIFIGIFAVMFNIYGTIYMYIEQLLG